MSDAFARAAAVLHRNSDLSTAAVYTLPNGAALQVRVVEVDQERELDVSGGRVRESVAAFELLASAVPERPAEGSTISVGPLTYRVFNVDRSNTRKAAWLLYCQAIG